MQLIIIEGLIGAGKTTLSRQLGEELSYRVMEEPTIDNPYLDKYYEDPKRWALEMQFWLMSRRFEMHQEAIEHIWKTRQSVIMDRSIYGDAVFCRKNFLDGNIEKIGYDTYLKMREVMFRFLLVPQTTIYLAVTPEKCLERIQARERNCEQMIPIEYLLGLHNEYEKLLTELTERGSNVLTLNWNSFQPIQPVIDQLFQKRSVNRFLERCFAPEYGKESRL